MNTQKLSYKNQKNSARLRGQRGIALVFTLLLLTMMIALSLAMAIAIGSQTMIAGYYKNYRGAFYAADSGVNIMRQSMLNQLVAAVPATFTTDTAPINNNTVSSILTNINTTYASWSPVNSSGSWPEQFELSPNTTIFTLVSCPITTTPTTGTTYGTVVNNQCTNFPPATDTIQTISYTYHYSVTAIGQVQNSEQQSVTDTGNLLINISVTPAGQTTTSFSAWGMFIDKANECDGTTLVPGTITGPVFTNGGFTFTPSTYIFTDNVGFGMSTAGFSPTNGGSCTDFAGPSYTDNVSGNHQTIAPQFNGAAGLQLSQPVIHVPTSSINQEWAVVDGQGIGESGSPNLGLLTNPGTGNAFSGSNGVYLPYNTPTPGNLPSGCTGPKCFFGGGIYVKGDVNSVTLSATTVTVSGAPHSMQTITIVQGGTTTVMVEDLTTPTTTITTNGGSPVTINALPENMNNTPSTPATMLYVDGNLGSGTGGLSGPGSGNPAVQDGAQMTIVANGNLNITGDILYKTEPVTQTQNQVPGTPADTLIPGSDHGQVLGIYTANGNVNLNNQQSSGNLEIDASVAAFSQNGGGGLTNIGSGIGTLNIVGGRIQSTIQNIGATTRNVYFDRRFAQGKFGPPWFPTAQVTPANLSATSVNYVVQRIQWLNNTATLN